MIEEHLRNWLLGDADITAYIGQGVYPQYAPETAIMPYIVYSIISDQSTLSFNGPTSIRNPRMQITIVADRQVEASQIAELVKRRINVWNEVYDDMVVNSCFAEGAVYLSLDYYTPPRSGLMIEAFLNWYPIIP